MIRIIALVTVVMLHCPGVLAQSFDCGQAQSQVERAICSSEELASLDESLADTYRQFRDSLDPEQRERATALQRLWLESRDRLCANGDPNSIVFCLKQIYTEWLTYGRSGVLFAHVVLESGETHVSPIVDNWRFEYHETDFESDASERIFEARLGLFVDDTEYLLMATNQNQISSRHEYLRELPNAIGYFLTSQGDLHVGFIVQENSSGGTCGYFERRDFVFLNRHVEAPQEFHRLNLSFSTVCPGRNEGVRSVTVADDGALEFMTPKGGHHMYAVQFVEPHITRIDSNTGLVEEYVRVDVSMTHFEGEPYDDLIARAAEFLQVQEGVHQNGATSDCGIPIYTTNIYWWLKQGEIPASLAQEGRPFGFQQLQHFVFEVLRPGHIEQATHYKPFIDGVLKYLDDMREVENWESRLRNAAGQYPAGGYDYEMADWTSNPFLEAGFPTNTCFNELRSVWRAVDLEQWIYLFWARRQQQGNLEVTERMLRRISAMLE